MTKKERIAETLIDIFDRIDIQTPNNFNKILDFVYTHVKKKSWDNTDVELAFKAWIESN